MDIARIEFGQKSLMLDRRQPHLSLYTYKPVLNMIIYKFFIGRNVVVLENLKILQLAEISFQFFIW